ncbi:MAG: TonB-dependent receptor [Candidatus Aminicenantales bacterium]
MRKNIFFSSWVWIGILFLAAGVFAINRGAVTGVARTSEGSVLANATVTIFGPLLPAGREFITGQDGAFRFLSLPPGKYTLTITHPEALDYTIEVIVSLDKETQVNAVLTPIGRVAEEVTVVAASPIVDVRSTEINTNWDKEVVQNLPLGRSYASLLQLAPGVADNRDFAPNAGGNKQDNVYLYDGSNITNPHFGYLGANFSEMDIQEVNIKRGALSAEFGRAAGMVTNAITKSGTNQISGSFRFIYEPSQFTWKSRDPNIVTKYDVRTPSVSLGGPMIKDKLWWYVSGNFPYNLTTGRVNNLGSVPDAKFTGYEFFGKISANPHPAHQFVFSFRNNDYKNKNAGIGVNDHPSVAVDGDGLDRIYYFSYTWIITPNTYLDVKYDHVDEKYKSIPITDLGYLPTFDVNNLARMGYFRTTTGYIIGGATASGQYVGGASEYNTQNFYRDEVKIVFSKYLDFRGHSHLIKLGFGFDDGGEYLERIANGWGSIIRTTYAGQAAFRARYYPKQDPQDSRGRTYAFFIQDSATIGQRLTILAGVLLNRDEFSTQTFERRRFLLFDFDQEIQPRLGFTYVLDKKAQDKIYANFGRYYCMDNKSIARAWAPLRIYRRDAYFTLAGALITDFPQPSETGKVILPNLKATYQDEWVVGYSRPITAKWFIDVWGQYRYMKNMLEDYPTVNRETAPSKFVCGNLDGSDRAFGALAKREYRAFTIQVQHPYADRWSLTATYTWSQLKGNWDLDYAPGSALYYASSYLEDGPGLYVSDPNRNGLMAGDRTHVFKLFGTWEFFERATAGAYLRVQSGRPWEARGLDYYGNYYRYLEKAGTRRLETWVNLDAQLSYVIPFGRFRGVVEARLMNVLNTQTVLSRDMRQDQLTFNNPTSYAPPRKFVLSFYINF